MPKGGYRPGAGRKKGQKDTKPRKGTEAEAEAAAIKSMLAMGVKAKARFYQEYLVRVANQDKKQKPLSVAEKRLMEKIGVELAAAMMEGKPEADKTDLEAGEFLRQVWNDPGVEISLRIRAAEIAFRSIAEKSGKKDEKNEAARRAGQGKFQAGRPPLAVVK